MKRALFAVAALFILANAASAQFPPAPVAPPPEVIQPAPLPAPVIVTAAPSSPNSDLFTAVWTIFGAIVLAIIGYVSPAVKQALTAGGSAAPPVSATVASVLSDPALKAQIEAVLSRVVSSGVPGTMLTTGASLVPGAGPIVALLEPMIRAAVMDALAIHTPPAVAAATTPAIAPVTNQLTDLLSVVNGLRAQVEALVPKGSI